MPGISTNSTSSSNNFTNSTIFPWIVSEDFPPVYGTIAPGSTLRPWMDIYATAVEGNLSVPQLQPCVDVTGANVTCSDLCTNTSEANIKAIFDPTKPDNLINCGLWRTACNSVPMDVELRAVWLQNFNVETFRSVGFEFPDENFTYLDGRTSMDWADCFGQLWALVHPNQLTTQADADYTLVPTMGVLTICDTGLIFDGYLGSVNFLSCIDQLCNSKGWLNPDIGGIGVYASFILQTVLAIILFALIATLERWPSLRKPQLKISTARGSLKDRLLAANSEFYKAQCYFTGSIQIASIVLASQNDWNFLVEYGLFFTLATSGYWPVILNLLCVSRYGRSSWYFIMLATCCFLLSTATLGFSQWYWSIQKSFEVDGGLANVSNEDRQSDIGYNIEYTSLKCGGNSATTLLKKWCDTPTPVATGTQVPVILSGWNWVLWFICLLWLFHCFLAKWHDRSIDTLSSPAPQGRMSRWVRYIRTRRFPPTPKPFKNMWWFLFAISWPLVLGYQLYLYSLFFTSSQINTEWGFGQIVAIIVWAPCLADFILVFREGIPLTYHYRLPKGFNVVKDKELPPLPSQCLAARDSNWGIRNAKVDIIVWIMSAEKANTLNLIDRKSHC